MIEIFPYNPNLQLFNYLYTTDKYTCNFQHTDTKLTVIITSPTVSYTVFTTLDQLKKLNTFGDFTVYRLVITPNTLYWVNQDLVRSFLKTEYNFLQLYTEYLPIYIVYRHNYLDDTFADGIFNVILTSPHMRFQTSNEHVFTTDTYQSQFAHQVRWDLTGSDSIPPDTTQVYKLYHYFKNELSTKPVNAYIKSNSGYLPKRHLVLQNGETDFKVSSLGLESGDTILLKVGSKYYSNEIHKLISIVE
jgi:hypothetical protein